MQFRLTQMLAASSTKQEILDSLNLHTQFIEASVDKAIQGVWSPWDTASGPQWFEGVNKMYRPEQLNELTPGLISRELNKFDCGLTPVRTTFGRGLITSIPRHEKEKIMDATALWFDSSEKIDQFLQDFVERRFAERSVVECLRTFAEALSATLPGSIPTRKIVN